MDKKIIDLTPEKFNELVKDDKWLREIYHSVKCYDKNGVFKHRKTVSYPVEYIVPEDLWKESEILFGLRKLEMLGGIQKGELVFVSMGCDDNICGEIGNHRIRTCFKNNEGKTYFVELLSGGHMYTLDRAFVDFSIDKDESWKIREYNKTVKALWDELSPEVRSEYARHPNRLPDMFKYKDDIETYNAMGVEKTFTNQRYTWAGVLAFVNETYGCSYTSARRLPIGYFNAEDFVCEC